MLHSRYLEPAVTKLARWPVFCLAALLLVAFGSDAVFGQERANQAEATRQQIANAAQAIIAPELAGRNLERDIECLESIQPLREFLKRIEKEYATEIREGAQPYRNVEGTIRYTREKMDQFENALKQFASLASLQADVEQIRTMLKLAVENQAPAYFDEGNDISRRRQSLKNKATVLGKLAAPADLEKALEIIQATEKAVFDAQAKLGKQIIEANQLPSDQYRGADRDELLGLVEAAWLKAVPDKKPVYIGLIGNQWSRTERWEVENQTLFKVERSQLQGFVLVPHNSETVACFHIQVRRDHLDNDRTATWLIEDPAKTPEPRQLIQVSKVPQRAEEGTQPTREALIAVLRSVAQQLESGQFEAAADFFWLPPDFKPSMLRGLIEKQEISRAGVARLASEATFGTALERFGAERATAFAQRAAVKVADCYGFYHEAGGVTAEVIAVWENGKFKLLRLDDVGKLPPE